MAGKRITKAEKEQRVQEVFELLVKGYARFEILQYVADETGWKLKPRQVDNYIADAAALLAIEAEYQRPAELAKALRRLDVMYKTSIEKNDPTTALAAMRERHKLLALYAPEAPKTIRILDMEPAQAQVLVDVLARYDLTFTKFAETVLAELGEDTEWIRMN